MNRLTGILVFTLAVLLNGCVDSQNASRREEFPARRTSSSLDAIFSPPSPETIPGDQRGEQIRLGYQIVVHTQDYAAAYVGNKLNCTNCHLDAGLDPNAASFVGLSRVYPEYRARVARVMTLADRVNECFERNLNGKPLPSDSSKLQAVVAYIDWLSENVPVGSVIQWRGVPRIQTARSPDPVNGKKVFGTRCVFCHGADGEGTMIAPPVWGTKSYTIASEMARNSVAASFIKANMPRTRGWALSDDEAYDVAAYINSQPRPDRSEKVQDWPQGGRPQDAPY
jgi:thiosulfate dehydrogenase